MLRNRCLSQAKRLIDNARGANMRDKKHTTGMLGLALAATLSWSFPARAETLAVPDKLGRHMVNARVAAELLTGWDSGMGWTVPVVAIEPAIGVTSSRNGYVVIPFSVQNFFNATALGIGIGYQHDIPLPIRRLYATARATVSYESYQIRNGSLFNGSITHLHTAAFQPSIGVKYVLAGRVNLGIDFASIKLRIQNGLYDASYQFVGSAGVTL